MIAQTLVKLRSWDIREALHYANKTAREKKVKIRVHHDLTKRRYGLLSRARALVDNKMKSLYTKEQLDNLPKEEQVFAFANINCELRIRARGSVHNFADDDELDAAYEAIFGEQVPDDA